MSNIDKAGKARLKPLLDQIGMDSAGELSYCISKLMMQYCSQRSPLTHDSLTACIGSAQAAVDTFTARVYGPFHAQEARENGDIYQEFIRTSNLKTLFG